MMNTRSVARIVFCASLVAGCQLAPETSQEAGPSDGSAHTPVRIEAGETVSGTVRYFGYLDVTRNKRDDSQAFEAAFARFEDPIEAGLVMKNFAVAVPDSCETSSRSRPIQIVDELSFPGHPYRFVTAGGDIPILYKRRRYARLTRSDDGDDMITFESAMSGAAATIGGLHLFSVFVRTDSLSIRIPGGADFPAIDAMAIPSVDRLNGFNLTANDRVAAGTRFRWRPAGNPDAMVQLSAGGGGRAIFCAASDDGEFELPDGIKDWLGEKTIPNPEAYRDATVFYRAGDAIFVVTQSSYL